MTIPSEAGIPAGLRLQSDIISEDEEQALIELIEGLGLTYPPYDPGNRRSSNSFGWKYDYAGDTFVPCPPLPEGVRSLLERVAAFAGVEPEAVIECLFNRYEQDAVIQPHFDKPVFEHVIGVSLGAPNEMQFVAEGADPAGTIAVPLEPRAAYVLAGDARHVYQHSLPPQQGTRYSITFRTLTEQGEKLRAQIGATL